MNGKNTKEDRVLFWHYPHYDETTPYSSALVGNWKIIRYADDDKVEVYNLKNDPIEQTDLSKTHPEKTTELVKILDNKLKSVNAQEALKNPDYDPNKFSGGIRAFRNSKKKK